MDISPKTRKYIYGVLIALLPLLIGYGLLDDSTAANIALIAAAVLGVSGEALALSKVEKAPDADHGSL